MQWYSHAAPDLIMTSSNGNIFRVTGHLCWKFTGQRWIPRTGELPAQRPVTRGFDVFFDLGLDKQLSKQSWGWLFETPSCPLWRHCWLKIDSLVPERSGSDFKSAIFYLILLIAISRVSINKTDGRLTVRYVEASKLRGSGLGFPIALKFDRHIDSSAVEMPVKFQSDTIMIPSKLATSSLHGSCP